MQFDSFNLYVHRVQHITNHFIYYQTTIWLLLSDACLSEQCIHQKPTFRFQSAQNEHLFHSHAMEWARVHQHSICGCVHIAHSVGKKRINLRQARDCLFLSTKRIFQAKHTHTRKCIQTPAPKPHDTYGTSLMSTLLTLQSVFFSGRRKIRTLHRWKEKFLVFCVCCGLFCWLQHYPIV